MLATQVSIANFLIRKYAIDMLTIDDYSTAKEMAERWGVTVRMVIHYCDNNLIPGAVKKGMYWLIPTMSSKPEDRRSKSYREKREMGKDV